LEKSFNLGESWFVGSDSYWTSGKVDTPEEVSEPIAIESHPYQESRLSWLKAFSDTYINKGVQYVVNTVKVRYFEDTVCLLWNSCVLTPFRNFNAI